MEASLGLNASNLFTPEDAEGSWHVLLNATLHGACDLNIAGFMGTFGITTDMVDITWAIGKVKVSRKYNHKSQLEMIFN